MTTTTATATALRDSLHGMASADKAAALVAAGYVRANGKPDWTAFYTAVLAEMPETVVDEIQLMSHYVNLYGQEFSPADLGEYWAEYKNQVEQDQTEDDVDAFCEAYGLTEIDNYSDYADIVNDYSQEVVDAFCSIHGVDYIKYFQECYQGIYSSEAEFTEQYMISMGNDFPCYVIIDWQATWDQSLRYDYDFDDETGAVFASNF